MARLAKAWQYLIFTALVGVLLAFLGWIWFESRSSLRRQGLAHRAAEPAVAAATENLTPAQTGQLQQLLRAMLGS
jgi:hypothetical protein